MAGAIPALERGGILFCVGKKKAKEVFTIFFSWNEFKIQS
jgi:hypothetical protein